MSGLIKRVWLLGAGAVLLLVGVGCESSDTPKRKKAVAPTADNSGLPWNRPTQAEAAGRFGAMMPQSR